MRVVRIAEVPTEPANSPLMTDAERLHGQAIVVPDEAKDFNCGIVNFPQGVAQLLPRPHQRSNPGDNLRASASSLRRAKSGSCPSAT